MSLGQIWLQLKCTAMEYCLPAYTKYMLCQRADCALWLFVYGNSGWGQKTLVVLGGPSNRHHAPLQIPGLLHQGSSIGTLTCNQAFCTCTKPETAYDQYVYLQTYTAASDAVRSAPLRNQIRTLSHALASGQLDFSQLGLEHLVSTTLGIAFHQFWSLW